MTQKTLLKLAWQSILKNKMRTVLTMLGIVIGVGSVIVMVAVGNGAQVQIQKQISSLGTNLILVLPGSTQQGGVSQGAGSTLTVGSTSTVNAGTGTIALSSTSNDFTGAVTLNATGATVSIRDTNNLSLATPTLGGNTGITAIAGGMLTLPAANLSVGTGGIDFRSNGGTLSTNGTLGTTSGNVSG